MSPGLKGGGTGSQEAFCDVGGLHRLHVYQKHIPTSEVQAPGEIQMSVVYAVVSEYVLGRGQNLKAGLLVVPKRASI